MQWVGVSSGSQPRWTREEVPLGGGHTLQPWTSSSPADFSVDLMQDLLELRKARSPDRQAKMEANLQRGHRAGDDGRAVPTPSPMVLSCGVVQSGGDGADAEGAAHASPLLSQTLAQVSFLGC